MSQGPPRGLGHAYASAGLRALRQLQGDLGHRREFVRTLS